VVDELDQPLAGALVVAVAACSTGMRSVSHSADPPSAESAGSSIQIEAGPATPGMADLARALAGGIPVVASTEADGRFTLPVLPPGRYMLFALHIGPPPATSEPIVVDGGFLTVPLRLVIARRAQIL